MTESNKIKEYQLIENIINNCEISFNQNNFNKFISFNLAKAMQYKKRIIFNPNHHMYQDLNNRLKNKLKIIGKKIDHNITILKDKSISKYYRIKSIRKLNKSLINFVDDATYVNDKKIVMIKIKKLKI